MEFYYNNCAHSLTHTHVLLYMYLELVNYNYIVGPQLTSAQSAVFCIRETFLCALLQMRALHKKITINPMQQLYTRRISQYM